MNSQYMPQPGGGFGAQPGYNGQPGYPAQPNPPPLSAPPLQQTFPGVPTKTNMPSLNMGRPSYPGENNVGGQSGPYPMQRPPSVTSPAGPGMPPAGPGVPPPGPGGPPQNSFHPPPPGAPPQGPIYPPPAQNMYGSQQPPLSQPNQLAGQMANMNINGHPQQPPMGSAYPSGGLEGPIYGAGSPRLATVNGAPPGQAVNGLPDVSGPGRPPLSRYPQMPVCITFITPHLLLILCVLENFLLHYT